MKQRRICYRAAWRCPFVLLCGIAGRENNRVKFELILIKASRRFLRILAIDRSAAPDRQEPAS
jgi:hypothetical protein